MCIHRSPARSRLSRRGDSSFTGFYKSLTKSQDSQGYARPVLIRTFSFVLALVVSATGAVAQINTGEIGGVVKDSSGAILPGATITATHTASGIVVERVTDENGRYFLPALRIGTWDIGVHLAGFAPQTQRGVVLEVGRVLTLEFTLS